LESETNDKKREMAEVCLNDNPPQEQVGFGDFHLFQHFQQLSNT